MHETKLYQHKIKIGETMEIKNIRPFVRFVRHLEINNTVFQKCFPLDARLFYVLEGEGKIETEEQIYTMPAGSVLYINAGCVYRLLKCNAVYIAVNFDFTFDHSVIDTPVPPVNIDVLKDQQPIEYNTFSDALCFNRYCFLENIHSLQMNLVRLEKEYKGKLSYYPEECSNIMASVIISMARRFEKRGYKEVSFDIEKVIEYIGIHYSENINNRIIGDIFHFHPNYIAAEFRRNTGKPLHKFLLETRIMNAVSLMESGYDSVNQIASLTGFCDGNYFSRYFKQIIGISPREYIITCTQKKRRK